MQEALLFDKIYILWPDRPSELWDLIKAFGEGNRDIVIFKEPIDVLEELDDTIVLPEDKAEAEALLSLFRWGGIASDKWDKHQEIMREFYTKFPESKEDIDKFANGNDNLISEPSRPKMTLEKRIGRSQELDRALHKVLKSFVENDYPYYDFVARLQAWILEHFENKIATPLLHYSSYQRKLPNTRKHDIAQLVIRDLPLPDSSTEWEQIIEYRENPDNRKALLDLRRWIRRISTEDISPVECAQELEWLESEFQTHMRLHKLKADTGTLEVVVKAPLEILENLVNLKFSKIVDPLFAIKKRRISLMEAELNAPGREIAYLVKAKQSFK